MKRYLIKICSKCKEIIDSEYTDYCSTCDEYNGEEVEVAIMIDMKLILERNYKICFHAHNVTRAENIKQDLHSRMDEISLIFSDCFKTNVIDAKASLEESAKEMIKKEQEEQDALVVGNEQ